MTTAHFEVEFKNKLKNVYDDREASNISDWVFENITGLKRLQRRHDQSTLSNTQKVQLENYLEELLQSKPVQYVLNEAWFYKRKFFVNEDTLIPRPETEELVGWVIHDLKETQKNKIQIIDIGTGSGCIPVSLKLEFPDALIDAVDISEKAILVARENAKKLKADINFLQLDFLQDTEWPSFGNYDVIISNPPYIPIQEKKTLSKNVADFEPGIALFVENNDPFIFYKKIVEFAQQHLTGDGKIYVEIHEEYASDVKNIFKNACFNATSKMDIFGKERMVRVTR